MLWAYRKYLLYKFRKEQARIFNDDIYESMDNGASSDSEQCNVMGHIGGTSNRNVKSFNS